MGKNGWAAIASLRNYFGVYLIQLHVWFSFREIDVIISASTWRANKTISGGNLGYLCLWHIHTHSFVFLVVFVCHTWTSHTSSHPDDPSIVSGETKLWKRCRKCHFLLECACWSTYLFGGLNFRYLKVSHAIGDKLFFLKLKSLYTMQLMMVGGLSPRPQLTGGPKCICVSVLGVETFVLSKCQLFKKWDK